MGKCLIFCAGGFSEPAQPIDRDDYILAADGGLTHLEKLGICPHGIIGDFDSLGYVPEGATVFPVEKDDTDSMLAVRKGLELGYREFILYGAMDGPRLDHTIANLQTLCFLAEHGATGYLVGLGYMSTAIREETILFPETAEGILSLFCFGSNAELTIHGTQYELEKGTLSAGFPLGVSNHFIGKTSDISVTEGTVLALFDRDVGFPERRPL